MKQFYLLIFYSEIALANSFFSMDIDFRKQNNEGVAQFEKQNFKESQVLFRKALAQSPYSAEVQFNLGTSFEADNEKTKAIQSYQQSLMLTDDSETLFKIYFNLAELSGRDKKIDEALSFYQKALIYKPESKEVKTNIELLIQQKNQDQKNKDQKDKDNDKEKKDQENKDKDNKEQNKDSNKDKKDQNKKDKDPKDKESKDEKDKDKENKNQKEKDQENNKEKKQDPKQSKPQPQEFKSQNLNSNDVKKILEEMDRQEQRVRAEYNKKIGKENPRDKDW